MVKSAPTARQPIIPNFVLLSGPQDGPASLDGFYTTEGQMMDAVERAEGRGEFCWAFALETPHYVTAEPEPAPE